MTRTRYGTFEQTCRSTGIERGFARIVINLLNRPRLSKRFTFADALIAMVPKQRFDLIGSDDPPPTNERAG